MPASYWNLPRNELIGGIDTAQSAIEFVLTEGFNAILKDQTLVCLCDQIKQGIFRGFFASLRR